MPYTFDDEDPYAAEQLEACRDAGHADFNADTTIVQKCLLTHSTPTTHRCGPQLDSSRCPGHGVALFIDAQENGATSTEWEAIRDELLRGQSWDKADAEVRRHMRILAEEAAVQAGLSRPSYEGIPDLGDLVVIVQVPQVLQPGNLIAVLGTDGRVQPPPIPIINPDPEAWTGPLVDMVAPL
jgi:hypothetical protein